MARRQTCFHKPADKNITELFIFILDGPLETQLLHNDGPKLKTSYLKLDFKKRTYQLIRKYCVLGIDISVPGLAPYICDKK